MVAELGGGEHNLKALRELERIWRSGRPASN